MRIAFLSDIHGNAIALDAVLEDIKKRKVDRVVILGDLCYRGPEPNRALELVKVVTTDVIKGNADEWIVRGVQHGEVPESTLEIMNKEREWTLAKLEDESINYLQNLPWELIIEIEGFKIHAFHATPHSLFEVISPNETEDNMVNNMMIEEADIYVYAHIHKSYIRYINGKCIINTGSVGLPFDGLSKASYALLEINDGQHQTSLVRVAYDIQKVINSFNESDYPNKEFMIKLLQNAEI
ncbi:metallophosphoesterase family protein [Bacillus sp. JJ1122]|uniref:metallophosphoesterase family protein n=1 Tax=Bacillus sp. JJ1122 TaxID=3122951 RepID=UPI002FFD7E8A